MRVNPFAYMMQTVYGQCHIKPAAIDGPLSCYGYSVAIAGHDQSELGLGTFIGYAAGLVARLVVITVISKS